MGNTLSEIVREDAIHLMRKELKELERITKESAASPVLRLCSIGAPATVVEAGLHDLAELGRHTIGVGLVLLAEQDVAYLLQQALLRHLHVKGGAVELNGLLDGAVRKATSDLPEHECLQHGLLCSIYICAVHVLGIAVHSQWRAPTASQLCEKFIDIRPEVTVKTFVGLHLCCATSLELRHLLAKGSEALLILQTLRDNLATALNLFGADTYVLGTAGLAGRRLAAALDTLKRKGGTLGHLGLGF